MKTEIIIGKGWITVKKYDFLMTMSKGDVVTVDCISYFVTRCYLDVKENKMIIVLES